MGILRLSKFATLFLWMINQGCYLQTRTWLTTVMKRSCLHMYPDRDFTCFPGKMHLTWINDRDIKRALNLQNSSIYIILLDKKMPSHAISFYLRACLGLKFLVVEAGWKFLGKPNPLYSTWDMKIIAVLVAQVAPSFWKTELQILGAPLTLVQGNNFLFLSTVRFGLSWSLNSK